MTLMTRRSAGTLIAATVVVFVVAIGFHQQPVAAQGGAGPKMEDQFMNIKALRGHPADQLNPTMVMFEAALGVGCPYCHDNDAAKRDAGYQSLTPSSEDRK